MAEEERPAETTAASSPLPPGNAQDERSRLAADFRDARRLYDAAGLIHERGEVQSVDSVLVLHPALRGLVSVLLRLNGEDAAGSLEELAPTVAAVNEKQSYVEYDLAADLLLVAETHRHATTIGAGPDAALARRYDRAFLRAGRLFSSVRAQVEASGRDGKAAEGTGRVALFVALAVFVGVLVGYRLPRKDDAPPAPPPAPAASASEPTGLVATFFADEELSKSVLTRTDGSVDFSWGGDAPPGLSQNDHFSVRWVGRVAVPANGAYGFRLSSDDGSRLFIDDRPVIDNWGSHTLETKEASVALTEGLHPIRVEYFDGTGDASVKLEWRGPGFDYRLASGGDFR